MQGSLQLMVVLTDHTGNPLYEDNDVFALYKVNLKVLVVPLLFIRRVRIAPIPPLTFPNNLVSSPGIDYIITHIFDIARIHTSSLLMITGSFF